MAPPQIDLIPRGTRGPSPFGTSIFILLRALDPLLQYYILTASPLTTIILPLLNLHPHLPLPTSPLSSPTSPPTLLLLMTLLATTKHIYWILHLCNEPMPANNAVIICVFNTLCNSLNTTLYTLAPLNPLYPSPASSGGNLSTWHTSLALLLFTAGITLEPLAEAQRKAFKDDPRNAGKLFSGGLFGYARNVNYGMYVVWRTGFAVLGGGVIAGVVVGGFFWWDFVTRGVPVLEEYVRKRYGETQWREVVGKVRYRLIPWVY